MPEIEDAQARVRAVFGDVVTAKPVEEKSSDNIDAETAEILTRVCYFYPQYDLKSAEKLTDSQVNALLLQAEKQRAIDFYNQTLIAAAPYSKKGELVKKLTKQYKKIIDS